MESKSKGEAAHLDASAKIGRGRGGDDGSDDGAALRADGGWRSAAASAPGLARPRGTAGPPPGAPSGCGMKEASEVCITGTVGRMRFMIAAQ